MKRLFPLICTCTILLYSCEAPRDRRTVAGGNTSNSTLFGNPTTTNGNTTTTNTGTGTTTTGTTSVTIPTEIQHCSWSLDGLRGYSDTSPHFAPDESTASNGGYTICKVDGQDVVYIQLANAITDSQVCLVPTTHSASNSTYIGEPRCLSITDNKKIYKVDLVKNRPYYTSYPITGVMVMRDKAYFYDPPFYQYVLSPDAYIYCNNWLATYGDGSYCTSFKNGGHYVYKQF